MPPVFARRSVDLQLNPATFACRLRFDCGALRCRNDASGVGARRLGLDGDAECESDAQTTAVIGDSFV
jgi:hypothetical protein